MTYKLIRANVENEDDKNALRALHILCFGDSADVCEFTADANWWLLYHKDNIAGFCGLIESKIYPGCGYLVRTGVIKNHRGKGLSRRLFAATEKQARKLKYPLIVSDTTSNAPSANGFIRAGYHIFDPAHPWGFPETTYWRKYLR
jgi:GNAT superfamily N-acetyltransferase